MLKYVVCLLAVSLVSAGPAHGYVWGPSLQGHGTKSASDAGKGARGTDELKQECTRNGGIYLSTNGECINSI